MKKLQKRLLYSFKRSFQLGDKKFRVIYTLKKIFEMTLSHVPLRFET